MKINFFKCFIISVIATTLLLWVPLVAVVFSAEDSITFSWEMLPESPPAIGYRIYQSEQDNTDSMLMIKDNILHSNITIKQQATCPVIVPDNAVTTLYYAIIAYNTAGPSGFSNLVSKEFDALPPLEPPLNPHKFAIEYTTDEDGNVTNTRVIR